MDRAEVYLASEKWEEGTGRESVKWRLQMIINILKRANIEFEYNKYEYSKLVIIANVCFGNW